MGMQFSRVDIHVRAAKRGYGDSTTNEWMDEGGYMTCGSPWDASDRRWYALSYQSCSAPAEWNRESAQWEQDEISSRRLPLSLVYRKTHG